MQSVSVPAERGLQEFYPALKQHQALDQVFRYQDLAALVTCLQGAQTNSEPDDFKSTTLERGQSQ
jgi:hypothetical protein